MPVVLVFVASSVVLGWAVAAEGSGFRPSAPAALVLGLSVTVAASRSPKRWLAPLLATAALGGAVLLMAIPAGVACRPPVVEFGPHLFESADGAHQHDRCQLESDRRSLAGVVLAASVGGAIVLLVLRSRATPQ